MSAYYFAHNPGARLDVVTEKATSKGEEEAWSLSAEAPEPQHQEWLWQVEGAQEEDGHQELKGEKKAEGWGGIGPRVLDVVCFKAFGNGRERTCYWGK